MAKRILTADRLRELVDYNPDTGVFTNRPGRRSPAGSIAGYFGRADGYHEMACGGVRILGHVAAWLYMTGSMPEGDVDHWDGVRMNNQWSNLRCVTDEVNNQNRRTCQSNNKCGFLGVFKVERNNPRCWKATVRVRGKDHHVGFFTGPDEAHKAYLVAKRKLHDGCTI